MAGAWGLRVLILQILVAVNASRLPATVELLVPGYRGSHAHGILWSTGVLLVTELLCLGAAIYFANLVPQFGAIDAVSRTVETRAVVTVASLVGLFAPFITILIAPAWISSRRRKRSETAA